MTEPTPAQRRNVMIYRDPPRRLDDGCVGCEKSATFCAANRSMNGGEDCCPSCTHGTDIR